MELDFTNNPAAPSNPAPANQRAANQVPVNQPPGQTALVSSQPAAAQPLAQPNINQPPPVVQPPPPPPPPASDYSPATQSAGPNKLLILIIIIGLIVVIGGVVGYLVNRNKNISEPTSEDSLTTVVDPQVANRDRQRQSDLAKIQKYIDLYYSDQKAYPVSTRFQRFDDLLGSVYSSLVPKYASPGNLPIDPLYPDYWYGYRSLDGKSYELTARLENETDSRGAYDLEGNFLYSLTPSTASGTTNSSNSSSSSTGSSLPTNNTGSLLEQ